MAVGGGKPGGEVEGELGGGFDGGVGEAPGIGGARQDRLPRSAGATTVRLW